MRIPLSKLFNEIPHLERDVKENYHLNTLKWEMFNEKVKYFTSLFTTNEETDEDFKEIENKFLYYLYLYGELFVTKYKNRYQLWKIHDKQWDGIYLEKVKISLIQPLNQHTKQTKIVEIPSDQGVYVYWEENITPSFVRLWEIIEREYNLYQIFYNATILDGKKLIYNINNDSKDITNEELNSILDTNTPYIKSIDPLSREDIDNKNIFQEIKFSSSTASQQYINLQNYRDYIKDLLGIVREKDTRQERTNIGQTIASNYQNENIETIILKNLNSFSTKMKKKFNTNIKFIETNNLTNLNNEIKEKQNESK